MEFVPQSRSNSSDPETTIQEVLTKIFSVNDLANPLTVNCQRIIKSVLVFSDTNSS